MKLDSAMASKMKNIDKKKITFLLRRWFSSKNTSWSLGGTKPLCYKVHFMIEPPYSTFKGIVAWNIFIPEYVPNQCVY